jgi:hypothetical protein
MTWFKVDDQFWGHPKQTGLPKGAVCLWVRAGSWSANLLTNGFVPAHMVAMFGCSKSDARALVASGLWLDVDGGYQFHDWTEYQPTREQVEQKRDEEARRKAEWRAKRAAQKAASDSGPEGVPVGQGRDEDVSPASVPQVSQPCPVLPVPDPTRPDPDSPNGESSGGGARKRARRIPDDFALTDDLRTWGRARGFTDPQLDEITENFVRYWRAKAGRDATKLDWPGTWQNWVAKESPDRVRGNVHPIRRDATGQRTWSSAELDAVLGPDMWRLPQPPRELSGDGDAMWEWEQQVKREHRAERVRQAEAKLAGAS